MLLLDAHICPFFQLVFQGRHFPRQPIQRSISSRGISYPSELLIRYHTSCLTPKRSLSGISAPRLGAEQQALLVYSYIIVSRQSYGCFKQHNISIATYTSLTCSNILLSLFKGHYAHLCN